MHDGSTIAEATPEKLTVDAIEAEGLARLLALKDGDTFLVQDEWGDLTTPTDGLFHNDTRILSRLVMRVGTARPSKLSSGVSTDNVAFTFNGSNRPLPPMGGRSAPAGVLHIERRRFLWEGRIHERVRLVNHAVDEVILPLSFDYAADFADIFEVRGMQRAKRGTLHEPEAGGRGVRFAYTGLDEVERGCCIAFSEPPARLSGTRAEFLFIMPREAAMELYIEIGPTVTDWPERAQWRHAAACARKAMRRKKKGAHVRSSSPRFNAWLNQSRADLALLTSDLPTGPYPFAGIPWFSTPFGRDGILTAWEMLWLDPSLAKGVLSYLAARQATEVSAFQDSAPGKIMHETRQGEMAHLKEHAFGVYYGGVDTTPLFVALAGAYARRTGDLDLIRAIWPNLMAACGWMTHHGDSDGDGLIDYARGADTGLSNQGWKDSEDSVFHTDGRFPRGPIALLEVQGYAYSAWLAMAELGRHLDDDRAAEWEARAAALAEQVERRFWMEDRGFYGIAIDGEGRRVESLGSNAGHLLFSRLPAQDRADRVTERLMAAEFRNGWGVRTLATGQARFNPMSYHNGSVWPHDTAICAAGMADYGERSSAGLLMMEMYNTATRFDMRLPELFCGFAREAGEPPIAYPVACMPQAWAAASVFLLLQASLGVKIDALAKTVTVDRPTLPAGVHSLVVSDLAVGGATFDLRFERLGDRVVASAIGDTGGLDVISRL